MADHDPSERGVRCGAAGSGECGAHAPFRLAPAAPTADPASLRRSHAEMAAWTSRRRPAGFARTTGVGRRRRRGGLRWTGSWRASGLRRPHSGPADHVRAGAADSARGSPGRPRRPVGRITARTSRLRGLSALGGAPRQRLPRSPHAAAHHQAALETATPDSARDRERQARGWAWSCT